MLVIFSFVCKNWSADHQFLLIIEEIDNTQLLSSPHQTSPKVNPLSLQWVPDGPRPSEWCPGVYTALFPTTGLDLSFLCRVLPSFSVEHLDVLIVSISPLSL